MVENGLVQLERSAKLDVFLTRLTHDMRVLEMEQPDIWWSFMGRTQAIIRHSIFASWMDVDLEGSEEEREKAYDIIAKLRIFHDHELLSVDLVADEELQKETAKYIQSQQPVVPVGLNFQTEEYSG